MGGWGRAEHGLRTAPEVDIWRGWCRKDRGGRGTPDGYGEGQTGPAGSGGGGPGVVHHRLAAGHLAARLDRPAPGDAAAEFLVGRTNRKRARRRDAAKTATKGTTKGKVSAKQK